jgi:protein-disulfide isomerase
MTAPRLNLVNLLLAFVGFYISMLLSLEKALRIELPCGTEGGCSVVSSHPSSIWLGFPVAYYGVLGWGALLAISVLRSAGDLREQIPLVRYGMMVSFIGSVAVVYLQYVSLAVIGAFCPYCFTQAVAMVLWAIVNFLLYRKLTSEPESPAVVAGVVPMTVFAVLVSLGGLTIQTANAKRQLGGVDTVSSKRLENVEIVPDDAYVYGQKDAPITIVEFADLCCPTCQIMSPKVKEFVDQNPGKVRWIYRHFLIPSHRMAGIAAAFAEYAGENGRYYEYIETLATGLNGQIPEEIGPMVQAAKVQMFDPATIKKALDDSSSPIFKRIERDAVAASQLGVNSTPTFFVLAPGQPTRTARADKVFELLTGPDYKAILSGDSPATSDAK